ncbi:MAG: AMP-binding protein, partial [Clostridia bacterium]|nr:AMP-binding protein [Clostridia bacterium]
MKKIKLYQVNPIERLQDILDQAEKEAPQKVAYRFRRGKDETEITYRQFYDEVRSLGSALAELGLDEGHIACIGDNSYNWIRTFLTGLLSRGVFVPVDKQLPEADILNVLTHSEAQVVFYARKFETFFREKEAELPGVKYFIGFDREEDDGKFLSLKKLLDRGAELYRSGYTVYTAHMKSSDPHALKLLLYTSGTTGKSKGVMLTEDNLVGVVYYGLQVSTIYTTGLSVLPY